LQTARKKLPEAPHELMLRHTGSTVYLVEQ
jgi:hypothetical protein